MKKRIFALALALCMMLSVMPTSFAGNGFLTDDSKAAPQSGVLTDDSKAVSQSGVLTGASKYYRDGILYNTGSQSGASYSLPSGTLTLGDGAQTDSPRITDYEFGVDTSQTDTSMRIDTGSSSSARAGAVAADVLSYDDKYPATTYVDKTKSGIDTLTKTATAVGTDSDGDQIFRIDMTAGTASEITVTGAPCNIVLVLDASKTMKDSAEALKTAVDGFIDTVAKSAPGSKIAVVGYASSATAYKGRVATTASNALQPVMVDKKDASGKEFNSELKAATAAVQDAIGNETGVQKRADAGLEMAVDILHAVPSTDTSKPIVILFTNGIPTDNVDASSVWDTDAYGIAQDSIHWSAILKADKGKKDFQLDFDDKFYSVGSKTDTVTQTKMNEKKNGCGATVYCVGVNLPNATKSSSWGKEIFNVIIKGGSVTANGAGLRANEFLYRVSSHVTTGRHEDSRIEDYGYIDAKTRGLGYYMVAERMDDLKSMFEEIKIDNGATVSDVTYRDYIAPGFVPCDASGNPLSVGTQRDGTVVGAVTDDEGHILYYSVEKSKITLEPSEDGSTNITVSAYVKPDDHLGGKGVYTNIAGASGIYSGTTNIGSFPAPTVDLPVKKIEPGTTSFTIYLSNKADLAALVRLDSRLDGKKNAGVTVTYTIKDGETEVASYTVPKGTAADKFPEEIIEGLETCKTYAIVCTVDGDPASDADASYYKTTEKTATVHVKKPKLAFDDVNVYLGKTPVFDEHPTLSWVSTSGDTCGDLTGTVPTITCTFVNNGTHYLENTTVTPTANLTGTGIARSVKQAAFNVFVYAPVVTYQDTAIYLGKNANFEMESGETATANLVSTTWKHGNTSAPASMGTAPKLAFNYSEKETDLTDCKDVYVKEVGIDENASIIVGDKTYNYVDYVTFLKGEEETDTVQFTVHVVKPVITSADITIYLSNTVDLNGQMTEVGNWVCGHTGSEQKSLPANNGETRLAPTIDYTFKVDSRPVSTATAYQPLGCTEIKATATVNGKDAPISKDAISNKDYSTFRIHVLKPAFTVTCTDLWADYLSNVDLDGYNHITLNTTWSDDTHSITEQNAHKTKAQNPGLTVAALEFAFDCGTDDGIYNLNQTSDQTVNINSASWTFSSASDGKFTQTFDSPQPSFIIHVNKFDLTISKTWKDGENVADGTYKQDAIFTVSSGLGEFQVVLPAGQESITIKNLLCGQDYSVTEDSNWTWRWSDDGTKTVTTHKHGVTTDMPTSHIASEGATAETSVGNSVSFINTLVKQLWFDFCKLVQNIFGVGKGE